MRPRALGALLVVSSVTITSPGRADAPVIEVRVVCDALSADARAVLEARARAELVAESSGAVELSVRCVDDSATVDLRSARGRVRSTTVALRQGGADAVDALLDALHGLAGGEGAPPAFPSTSAEPEPVDAPEPRPPESARRWLAAVAGADVELWSGSPVLAVGGHGGVSWLPREAWLLSVRVGAQSGVGGTLGAWGMRGALGVERHVTGGLWLGGAGTVRGLWAAYQGATQDGASVGAALTARYVAPVGALELSAGASVEALIWPVVVDVAGAEVFRLPSVLGGLSLEAAYPGP